MHEVRQELASAPDGSADIRVVGAAIVDDLARPSRLLAARRVGPDALAGRWELPGGKIDPGEGAQEALHRELREELGVRVELGPFVAGDEPGGWWRLSPRHVMAVWWAQVVDGVPRPIDEHDDLRWVGRDDAFDVAWLDGDAPVVQALIAHMV